MGIYEALRLFGMNYIRDPSTPYDVLSEDELAIDYLQFPRQTLQYKAGDCDDLSILYSSLLEAAGIETAFITVPGHIYVAFALKTIPEEIRKAFSNPEDLIYLHGKAWLPVEVTLLDQGFLKSWETGLSLWTKYEEQRGFFPVHTAWEIYKPVGFASRSSDLDLPDSHLFADEFSRELERFIQRELQPRVDKLMLELAGSNRKERVYNKIGVLYARFGLYDRAEIEFKKGTALFSYSSLVNLGNIYFLREDYEMARDTFLQALETRPQSSVSLLGLAKSEHELNHFDQAEKYYQKLIEIKPIWGGEFAYLSSNQSSETRASEQMDKFTMYWEDEEN